MHKRIIRNQIREITDGIEELSRKRGDNFSIKQLEKTKKNLEAKLDKLVNSTDRDDVVTFEELGIDKMFVDEAHSFKNLFLYTKMRNVAGIQQTEAQKSADLYMKCQYLDELTGGKGCTFATGTPISNSMTELYTMMRYLQADKTGHHVFGLISSTLDDIDHIGFEERGWAEFFEGTKKIPVVSFGNESGDNVHALLDTLIASAFEWQRDHDTAPLSIVIDELKDQNFAEGSPLHTILTQGRKFHTKFIGMTQQYISNSSHAIDVVKEAGIKVFFKPAKSLDRIAAELGYKNPADAGFGSMSIGDTIICAELFNKEDGVNEPAVIHVKAIKFIDTPLFEQFKKEYGIK